MAAVVDKVETEENADADQREDEDIDDVTEPNSSSAAKKKKKKKKKKKGVNGSLQPRTCLLYTRS